MGRLVAVPLGLNPPLKPHPDDSVSRPNLPAAHRYPACARIPCHEGFFMLRHWKTRMCPAWPTGLTIVAVLGLLLGLSSRDARAQAGPGPRPQAAKSKPDDPKAKALFDEVAKAYKTLGSYADHGEFIQAMTIGGKPQKQTTPINVTLARPNKVKIGLGPVEVYSDGKTLTTAVGANLKKYTEEAAPKTISIDMFRQGPTGSILFGGPSGPATFVLLNYLTSSDPGDAIRQLGASLQSAGPNTDGTAFMIDLPDVLDLLLTVEPKTKLLTGIEMKIDPERIKDTLKDGVTIQQWGWRSGEVSTAAIKDQAFAFQPAEGYKKVESLVERQQPQERKTAVHGLVGKPAPDFTLTVLDGPGKTKTITKAELAGKVVVIDFWATWCGPCMMELPEVAKVIENFAGSKKQVVIVALSQDREPEEISKVRELVETTLKEKKITLTGTPVGLIALDPSNTIGTAFEIEGLPTLLLLDAKGVVRSVHVGYDRSAKIPFSSSLASEIDGILEGKPVNPHDDQGKVPAGK
jgi:thiol-disulfide isomerase/thioredoxin